MNNGIVFVYSGPTTKGLTRAHVVLRDPDPQHLSIHPGTVVHEVIGVDVTDAEGQAQEWVHERLS